MWVEDGVVEVPFFDRNSYYLFDHNSTFYSLHNGMFQTTTNEDQFIDRNQLNQIMTDNNGLKVTYFWYRTMVHHSDSTVWSIRVSEYPLYINAV